MKFITVDLVGFIQINSSFTNSMPKIAWPSSFSALAESLRSAFNVGFVTELGKLQCWAGKSNYCSRALNAMLVQTGFLAAAPLFMFMLRMCGTPQAKRCGPVIRIGASPTEIGPCWSPISRSHHPGHTHTAHAAHSRHTHATHTAHATHGIFTPSSSRRFGLWFVCNDNLSCDQ